MCNHHLIFLAERSLLLTYTPFSTITVVLVNHHPSVVTVYESSSSIYSAPFIFIKPFSSSSPFNNFYSLFILPLFSLHSGSLSLSSLHVSTSFSVFQFSFFIFCSLPLHIFFHVLFLIYVSLISLSSSPFPRVLLRCIVCHSRFGAAGAHGFRARPMACCAPCEDPRRVQGTSEVFDLSNLCS